MGGSSWTYVVPYQTNIQQAFDALRQHVFTTGDYPVVAPVAAGMTFNEFCSYILGKPFTKLRDPERHEAEETFRVWNIPYEPTTIEALLEWNGSEGTGTILDVETFAAMHTLTDADLLAVFGTRHPTRAMVNERGERALMHWLSRDKGGYLIVYEHGEPCEIFFTGCTGDG